MDILKNGMQNLKGIGFGSAVPGLRDQVFNAVNNVTASDEDQKNRIRSVIQEEEAQKAKQALVMRQARNRGEAVPTMKKGGKVSSASKRGDGCCIKGKTKGKMV